MKEQAVFILSAATVWFLVLDPVGNLPLFISMLRECDTARYRRIVLREGGTALGILLLFLGFGEGILKLLRVSAAALEISGGVILFLIALKMVLGLPQPVMAHDGEEPCVVPLAVPLFAGPSAITFCILIRGNAAATFSGSLAALLLAWSAAMLVLLSGRTIGRRLGQRGMAALEALAGWLLAVMATEMILSGFRHGLAG